MPLEIQAIYENGVLKPEHPLPLEERQRVTVVIHDGTTVAEQMHGIIGWRGDAETVRRIANN